MVRFMLVSLFALTFVATLVAVPHASAQIAGNAPQGDSYLLKALQKLGYRYRVDSNGWTVIEVPGEDGGTTEVIMSPEQNVQGDRQHMALIPVGVIGDISEKKIAAIKRISAGLPFGNLQLKELNNGKFLVYIAIMVPMGNTNFDTKVVAELLRYCAKASRETETALRRDLAA